MDNFFGITHKQLRDQILGNIKAIQDGDMTTPRIMILQGESGVGKSKIIREVYASLRAQSLEDYEQYWPNLVDELHLSTKGGMVDPLSERKILGPTERITFTKKEYAVPTFNWIPIKFQNGPFDYINTACAQISSALNTHRLALSVGLWLSQTIFERFNHEASKAISRIRPKTSEDYANLFAEALSTLGVAVTPGLGYVFASASSIRDRFELGSQMRKSLRDSVHVGSNAADLITKSVDVAAAVREFATPKMPAIIAVEDLQWMDGEIPVLIKQLASKVENRPLIILGSMWPFSETPLSVEREVESWVSDGIAQLMQVPSLESDELLMIIDQIAPATDKKTQLSLVKRWNNPYRLKLFLTWSPIVQRMTRTDAGLCLSISESELDTYPTELQQMYQARWDTLDQEVKSALAAAAAAIPADQPNHAFVIEIIAKAIANHPDGLLWGNHEVPNPATEDLILNYYSVAMATSWLQETEIAEVFRETFLAEIALKAVAELIDSPGGHALRSQVCHQICAEIQREIGSRVWLDISESDNDKTVFLGQWLLALMEETEIAPNTIDSQLDVFLKLTKAQMRARVWDFSGACEALPDHLASLEGLVDFVTNTETLRAAVQIVQWLGDSGDTELARDACRAFLLKAADLDHITLELLIETEIALANWTGICKDHTRAIEIYEDLANKYMESDSLSRIQAIKIRNGQALWAVESGDWARALQLYESALAPAEESLGPWHHITLEVRRGYARSFGELKESAKAVELYREIYEECLSEFGANGPETVEAQRGLARWTLSYGNVEEANQLSAEALQISKDSFGPDHFLTLWAYVTVVKALIASGELDRAKKNLRELRKRKNVLDSSHNIHAVVANLEVELEQAINSKTA